MAVDEARKDVQSQERRASDEDSVINNESLKETHEQVQDMVRLERSELNLIGEQCMRDIKMIGERGGREEGGGRVGGVGCTGMHLIFTVCLPARPPVCLSVCLIERKSGLLQDSNPRLSALYADALPIELKSPASRQSW